MTINKTVNGANITLALEGRLDTTTAPELDAAVKDVLPAAKEMVIDFAQLAYCSSAGLRVLLATHKAMLAAGGKLIVANANETVKQVFVATGLTSVLNLQ